MPFAENLTPFFNTAEFATAATLNGVGVNGIIDRPYLEALGNDVQGAEPYFLCAAASVPTVAQGQTLIVAGTTYKVRGIEPDGTGVVLLRLEQQ
jgi:hypothetical protein